MKRMLSYASRRDYIDDDDEVLAQFGLDRLCSYRGFEFGESVFDRASKGELCEEAERFLARDAFLPELERIYTPTRKHRSVGHPVHYMIQTDDRETRNRMYQVLLRAL